MSAGQNCPACADARQHPLTSGQLRAGCDECTARLLSGGVVFAASLRERDITPKYRAALELAFGADWEAGHERVKRWAKLRQAARKGSAA
jgi:uncharacterized protein (DUF1697 family)